MMAPARSVRCCMWRPLCRLSPRSCRLRPCGGCSRYGIACNRARRLVGPAVSCRHCAGRPCLPEPSRHARPGKSRPDRVACRPAGMIRLPTDFHAVGRCIRAGSDRMRARTDGTAQSDPAGFSRSVQDRNHVRSHGIPTPYARGGRAFGNAGPSDAFNTRHRGICHTCRAFTRSISRHTGRDGSSAANCHHGWQS